MKDFDHLDLDGRTLWVFLKVMEQGSVSRAARQLGVTQSAVSHTLDKLRRVLGDPLFVRSGRGIVATQHARELEPEIRKTLEQMRGLAERQEFDPGRSTMEFAIAANDFQRDLLLPPLTHLLASQAPGMRLRIVYSGVPSVELLRNKVCDLIITPRPPDSPDLMQKRLLESPLVCYYDAQQREAPDSLEAYLDAPHISVAFTAEEANVHQIYLPPQYRPAKIPITLPNFSGIALFLRNSRNIATLPALMGRFAMAEFATAPPPFPVSPIPLFMVWHRRDQIASAHRWMRGLIESVAAGFAAGDPPPESG
jgi:DNA-binding transcriptional LysR family regulator